MHIIRFWLEQLFKCAFKEGGFNATIFNPEMLNLLFDNDKAISPQFNIQQPHVVLKNNTFDDFLKFTLNHLANSTYLILDIFYIRNFEEYADILFNILTNEGNKFPKIILQSYEFPKLYDLIVEYIITSKDCSKMVSDISLDIPFQDFKLNKRAENVQIRWESRLIRYQIANIYNPKVRFSFNKLSGSVFITRM
ncbi:unnamed protein product [Meloidogyne enterolobii]|uniref:Uncharacterized protein n=1 Tax=Meloidogyne enterolobii TaxID=390850 RepID=A0ACB0YXB7_MELEN